MMSNATQISLNDRFTVMSKFSEQSRRRSNPSRNRSRSRSRSRGLLRYSPEQNGRVQKNQRMLQQLDRRHTVQAALKLKRRSVRTIAGGVAGGAIMKRGSIKALRVAPNGRPIKANSLTNVATMNADFITNNNRRPLRRTNPYSERPIVGGAAQRVARRRLNRARAQTPQNTGNFRRARSRSRSRMRMPAAAAAAINMNTRGRSMSRGRAGNAINARGGRSLSRGRVRNVRGRSLSRGRAPIAGNNRMRSLSRGRAENARFGRTRSQSRGRFDAGTRAALPIKARLGVRGEVARGGGRRGGRPNRGGQNNNRRGVLNGRVQKRNNVNVQRANLQNAGGAGGRVGYARGRSTSRNPAGRSRSRTRKGSVGVGVQRQQQQQQQRRSSAMDRGARRGRNQRRNGRGRQPQRQGNTNGTNGQQQQRRGRSRSRGGRGGGRNLGGTNKPTVDKNVLDKELDQYMATTKTENDMDYLLKT